MGNSKIQDAIDNGYDFQTTKYYARGWKIFSQNPGAYLGFEAIQFLVSIVLGLIPFLGTILQLIVNPPLQVGTALAAHDQESKNDTEFGNFFKGFEYFAPLLIANIIKSAISIIIFSPVIVILGISFFKALVLQDMAVVFESFEVLFDNWLLMVVIIMLEIYLFISLRWSNYLIVFHSYDAIEAIKTSWALINKNWFGHLGFVLMTILAFLLGILSLIVGIFIAIPVIYTADYAGFADITGLNQRIDMIDDIGLHEDLV